MDDADLANRHTETLTQANCYQSRKPEPKGEANGRCWQCTKPVAKGWRWCNAICRDNWQADNKPGGLTRV